MTGDDEHETLFIHNINLKIGDYLEYRTHEIGQIVAFFDDLRKLGLGQKKILCPRNCDLPILPLKLKISSSIFTLPTFILHVVVIYHINVVSSLSYRELSPITP